MTASNGADAAAAAAVATSSYGDRIREERRPDARGDGDGPPSSWSTTVVWARDSAREGAESYPAFLPEGEDAIIDLTGDHSDDAEGREEEDGREDVGGGSVWIKWQATGIVVLRPRSLVSAEPSPRYRGRRPPAPAAVPVETPSSGGAGGSAKATPVTPAKDAKIVIKSEGSEADDGVGAEIPPSPPSPSPVIASEREDPRDRVGRRVAKLFGGTVYRGTVARPVPPDGDGGEDWWFRVAYDDGDEEDMDRGEVDDAMALHERAGDEREGFERAGPRRSRAGTPRRRRAPVRYAPAPSSPRKRRRLGTPRATATSNANAGAFPERDEGGAARDCVMCVARGRASRVCDPGQFLPVRLKPRAPKGGKGTVAWVHACCALRAPLSSLCRDGRSKVEGAAGGSVDAPGGGGDGGEGGSPLLSLNVGGVSVASDATINTMGNGKSECAKDIGGGIPSSAGSGGLLSPSIEFSSKSNGSDVLTRAGPAMASKLSEDEVPLKSRLSLDTGSKNGSMSIGAGTSSDGAPHWWEEVAERTHGHPGLTPSRFDSTSSRFVPYHMTFSDWVDELALYDFRRLLASSRRFDEGRPPPYNAVRGGAALWRIDDRGSTAYCRMAPGLERRAREEGLPPAAATLWGAIAYRCFNRLSTFSRWAAVRALSAEMKVPVSEILRSSRGSSVYELACHGPPKLREGKFHAIAASGVTLHGRCGVRDKWGKDFCLEQMDGERTPMCCIAEIPLPSEIRDFATFIRWEVAKGQGRSVMTGEHQVQSKDRILLMLQSLAAGGCDRLRKMSSIVQNSRDAKTVLAELQTLDTVGYFFAWQIFSDLVAIQHHCQLFPDNTILPSAVVRDSLSNFALFGPGARKGAHIVDGGAAAVLEHDKDSSQEKTLERARRILAEFPAALKRTQLEDAWNGRARGRPYDLETLEHSLCDFYGALAHRGAGAIRADGRSSDATARAAEGSGCAWPPDARKGPSHSAGTRERQGGPAWRPNPCTAMERRDLQRMVTAAGYRGDDRAEGVEKEETF